MAGSSPTVRRRQLGMELRRLRELAGKSQDDRTPIGRARKTASSGKSASAISRSAMVKRCIRAVLGPAAKMEPGVETELVCLVSVRVFLGDSLFVSCLFQLQILCDGRRDLSL